MLAGHKTFFKLSLLIILIVTVGLIPDWLQYGMFFVGGDFTSQQVPFIIETKRMLSSGAPWWSWNTYFGDNFIAAYSFYTLTSPFVWINCLFPYDWIPQSITLTLYLKFLCTGWFSYAYFRKMAVSEQMSLVGALLYSFSSFVISNINYYHFFEPLMCFPLLLIAIERYLRGERYGATALMGASFLVAFINFYFIPCSFIPAAIYTIFRITAKDIRIPFKRIIGGVLLGCSGIMMASFVILPTVLHLIGGERANADVNFKIDSYEILLWLQRFRSLFIPGVSESGNSLLWLHQACISNASHIAVFGLLLTLLYIRKNKGWLSWLVLVLITIYVTPLNGIFSLYTNPYYSRWAYALTLFIVLSSVKYIDQEGRISWKCFLFYVFLVAGVCLVSYFPVFYNWYKGGPGFPFNDICLNVLLISLILLSLLFVAFYVFRQNYYRLMTVVCAFSVLHLAVSLTIRSELFYSLPNDNLKKGLIKQYVIDNDFPRRKDAFHARTDALTRSKNYYANIGLLKNLPSVSTYNSVQNKYSRRLFFSADTIKSIQNHFNPTINRTSLDALMSVSTIIEYHDLLAKQAAVEGIKMKQETPKYTVFDFMYYIPMGFTYDSYVTETEVMDIYGKDDRSDIPLQLLANLTVKDDDAGEVGRYLPHGTPVSGNPIDSVVAERRKNVCSRFSGDTRGFEADINMTHDNYVFFSVPADPGFTVTIDCSPYLNRVVEANFGLSAILVPKGHHHISFSYLPPGLKLGTCVSCLMLLLFLLICYKESSLSNTHQ